MKERPQSHTSWEHAESEIRRLTEGREKLKNGIDTIERVVSELKAKNTEKMSEDEKGQLKDQIFRYEESLKINYLTLKDYDEGIVYWQNEKEKAGEAILNTLGDSDKRPEDLN